jgi:DNA-binding transcriptional ArsR family regulator
MKISKQIQIKESEKNVMQFFSSLADETRLHILLSIAENPKTVNEIYDFVGRNKMTLSAISHQLKQLSDQGIVISEKKGQEKFFELSNKFCWCILRDAFKQFNNNINIKCKKCEKRAGDK